VVLDATQPPKALFEELKGHLQNLLAEAGLDNP
jgi:hypothetical protein